MSEIDSYEARILTQEEIDKLLAGNQRSEARRNKKYPDYTLYRIDPRTGDNIPV